MDNKRLHWSTPSSGLINCDFSSLDLKILRLVCEDMPTKEIAFELQLSQRSVERHISKMYKITKTKTPAGLLKYAYKMNLIII